MTIIANTKQWSLQFDQQILGLTSVVNKVQVEAAKEVLDRVEKRTPVGDPSLWKSPAPPGYVPGSLRASWTLTFNQVTPLNVTATLENSQPYAERVEYGWSTQAPEGMLRITIKEWSDIIALTTATYKL